MQPTRSHLIRDSIHVTTGNTNRTQIVVLGGGFAGSEATRTLERLFKRRDDIDVTLVSRDNFFVMTPLLFEACSGRLELRHCAQPLRPTLHRAQFVEATVERVDVERRIVTVSAPEDGPREIPYDQLIVALGATTNLSLIPGSRAALTFKTMADALVLRNHVIERFERADATRDAALRQRLLTIVVIGGGLVGVELLGELTAFAEDVLRYYPRIKLEELDFHLVEASPRILPEIESRMAELSKQELLRRRVELHMATPVRGIEPRSVHLANDQTIEADTIVLAAGIVPSAVVQRIGVAHDKRGRITVDGAMRSTSHPDVWALGDCAEIPGPDGRPYPALAQHALREARHVAHNVAAVIDRHEPQPFRFRSLGTMVALGHSRAVAQVGSMQFTGFFAWWFRRTYYLFQMPRWDRRLRIVLDWTIALFFKPDITKVELSVEQPVSVTTAR
jgi:NADH:quinone reductase (non-electrogenic)